MHKILVPLDGSSTSEQALPAAQHLAEKLEAELLLVRAVPDILLTPGSWSTNQIAEILESEAKAARDYLENLSANLAVKSSIEVARGDAHIEILRVSENENCTMIIMTTHGRSGLTRWLMGSVAEKIVRGAHCPVITLTGDAVKSWESLTQTGMASS